MWNNLLGSEVIRKTARTGFGSRFRVAQGCIVAVCADTHTRASRRRGETDSELPLKVARPAEFTYESSESGTDTRGRGSAVDTSSKSLPQLFTELRPR